MAELRWTLAAANDLEAITNFIGSESPRAAQDFAVALLDATDRLRQFPNLGQRLEFVINQNVRQILVGKYRAVYRARETDVELIGIFHGSREMAAMIAERLQQLGGGDW